MFRARLGSYISMCIHTQALHYTHSQVTTTTSTSTKHSKCTHHSLTFSALLRQCVCVCLCVCVCVCVCSIIRKPSAPPPLSTLFLSCVFFMPRTLHRIDLKSKSFSCSNCFSAIKLYFINSVNIKNHIILPNNNNK